MADSQIKRRVINFGKFKIVMIVGVLSSKTKSLDIGPVLINLPAGYPVSHRLPFGTVSNGTQTPWIVTADGQNISLSSGGSATTVFVSSGNLWLPVSIFYLSD